MDRNMKLAAITAIVLVGFVLCGCAGQGSKESPIIQPSEVAPLPPGAEIAREPRPVAPDPAVVAKPVEPAVPDGPAPKVIGRAEVVAATMLQVNDRFITVDDVLEALDAKLTVLAREATEEQFRLRAQALILDEARRKMTDLLVVGEAERRLDERHIKQVDLEVATARKAMVAEAGGSSLKLEADLAREGRTLAGVLDAYRRSLMIRAYMEARFMPNVSINRRMLWDYYRAHRKDYTKEEKVQMQIIAAPLRAFLADGEAKPTKLEQDAAKQKAREVIDEAVAALKGGEEFGKVAVRLSKGVKAKKEGIWPMMLEGSFLESKVEEAAFAMSEGQVSDPIETESGYYIVKTRAVQPGVVTSFEDAQEQIDGRLRRQQLIELQEQYFRKLRGEATIIQSEQFIQVAVEKAVTKYKPGS
jgi:hypothetical protein